MGTKFYIFYIIMNVTIRNNIFKLVLKYYLFIGTYFLNLFVLFYGIYIKILLNVVLFKLIEYSNSDIYISL